MVRLTSRVATRSSLLSLPTDLDLREFGATIGHPPENAGSPSSRGCEMRATLRGIQPYELHGTQYYQLVLNPDGAPRPIQARLSHDMIEGDLEVGDAVEVHQILGIVDRVKKVVTEAE